jgi:tRNA threonylcarbamoyl adenosine modification protein YeaZ
LIRPGERPAFSLRDARLPDIFPAMTDQPDSSAQPPKPPRVLAIDTALGACAAAVCEAGNPVPLACESIEMAKGHAEALMPLIQRVVGDTDGGFAALSRVAVTIGPGSFTGLRIGVAAARAIGLAAGIPVVGVSTLAAYAAPLITPDESSIIAAAIDARNGLIYFQSFAPGGRTMVPARITGLREAARSIGAGPVRLAGSGATALAIEAMSLGLKTLIADLRPAPDIAFVARLGLAADPAGAPARPLYLKEASVTPQPGARIARA